MGMEDDILQMLQSGPPQAPPDLRLLGWQLNQPEMLEYERKRRIYDTMASQLIPQLLNPMRSASVGEISQLSGMPLEQLATPGQMRTEQMSVPSEVPRFNFRQDPASMTLTPPGMGVRPGIEGAERDRYLATMTPGELDERWSLPSYQPFKATIGPMEGPPAPGMAPQIRPMFDRPVGKFEPEQGPPQEISRQTPDPLAPSTLPQQIMGMAAMERTKKWPTRGMGGSTWQEKYATIMRAYGKEAADYWAGEGFLPEWAGGVKAPTYAARAGASAAGAELKGVQTELTRKKVDAFDENTALERENKRSMVEARNKRSQYAQAESAILQRLRKAQAELAEMRVDANVPEREIEAKEKSIALMDERLKTLQQIFIIGDKYDKFSKEAEAITAEELAEKTGIAGPGVREPGFLESIGQGLGITPKGAIERTQPGVQAPKAQEPAKAPDAKQLEDAVTKEIDALLRERGMDPEEARKGPVKYKGKVYRFKGSKWAE